MGFLITVEGGEYTGKTSVVIPGLAEYFKRKGIPVLVSREPGGIPEAEKIRKVIFEKMQRGAPQEELAVLFMKARRLHLQAKIIPFLGKHKQKKVVVLLDRYLDSTRVYQGLEGKVPLEKIRALEQKYVGDYYPDLTLILYLPGEKFRETLEARMGDDREKTVWDSHDIKQHKRRQVNYLKLPDIARKWGEKRAYALIDATQTKESVKKSAIEFADELVSEQFDI